MNIPLRNAQVIWDYEGSDPNAPPIVVVGYDEGGKLPLSPRNDAAYSSSWGQCNSEFANATDTGQLFQLMEKFHELVVAEGLDPLTVHRALCVIPEYRVHLDWRGIGHTCPDELRDREAEEAVVTTNTLYHGRREPEPA